ncbi:hypothetical protein HG535_0E05560 [Zygotorulaspora mrakii]|uniref:Major facilitator superfamily (MFS) profile domain-containing protein n=1 Tax=Zygotorulaspora mrakii TaxID=42260 RepID=A0A7H9B6Q2_ZYGMR|nr:uncharacterized protein HG535_0E05560 [Zygotorulaspora mrakii]QLG73472.1 hypothetical protein HG535_0E05560 [Zygotorulaspora mrakii]
MAAYSEESNTTDRSESNAEEKVLTRNSVGSSESTGTHEGEGSDASSISAVPEGEPATFTAAARTAVSSGYDNASMTSAAESDIAATRKLSRILTGSVDEQGGVEVDYSDCPPMGGDRPFPPSLPSKDAYEVTFDGPNDPIHPFNWPMNKKILTCVILGLNCIAIAMGSSIFASAVIQICEIYHVIQVVAVLGVTLFVIGFAASPVIYAPLSEIYGRRGVLCIAAFGYAIFQFAVATGKDLQTIMICRFFGGLIGAAPMAVVPAAFADMFDTNLRGKAICLFALGIFVGPIIAPVIGSYIVQHTTWRWLEYVIGIFASVVCVSIVLFFEETHHPTILVNKAVMMRKKTNNWGIHAAHEDVELSIKEIVQKTVTRPIVMLFTEPVLLFVSMYNSFVYGILYLLLEAYPIVFVEGYGFRVNGELPYLALIIGMFFGGALIWVCERDYLRRVRKNGGLVPEARLIPMVFAGVSFSIGILWFCWTGNYHNKVHWMVPTVGGSFIGFGLIGIFLPCLNYIIESYLLLAASAVAANTFLRSMFGAAFPLFAGYMFHGMGTNWAGLLLGLFAAALIPVPLLLLKYGKGIRQKSKFAYSG